MNIALLYSGLPRWDRAVLQTQASLLQRPKGSRLEVYLAMWHVPGFDYSVIDNDILEVFGVRPVVSHLIDGYEPVIPHDAGWPVETKPANVYKMYRAIQYVNRERMAHVRASGQPHDVVVRSRPDLTPDKPVDLAMYAQVAQACLVLPRNGHWRGGYCDQFAIGNAAQMDHYADMHDQLDSYIQAGQVLHPERLLRHHLSERGCSVVLGDFEVNLHR